MEDEIIVGDGGNGSSISTNIVVDDFNSADENITNGDGNFIVDVGGGSSSGGVGSVDKLVDLLDVNSSNLIAQSSTSNKFVLTYDAFANKFVFVNPDDVLDASVGITTADPAPVGMSSSTIDYLDVELDNKIDLDAGEW